MERLTDCAQGYCEVYCKKYGHCFGDPGDCIFKEEVAMYEKLKGIEAAISFDHLRELVQAEKEEKLMKYLPGDTVYDRFGMAWTVKTSEIHKINGKLRHLYRCGHTGTDDYRALYEDEILTHKEAEKALEEVIDE